MENIMEFWTKLIVVDKEQTVEAAKSLKENCTPIDNWCWIFEGDIECLEDDGIKFNVIGEGAVPGLGDMTKKELVELCEDVYGVDVYKMAYIPMPPGATWDERGCVPPENW